MCVCVCERERERERESVCVLHLLLCAVASLIVGFSSFFFFSFWCLLSFEMLTFHQQTVFWMWSQPHFPSPYVAKGALEHL